MQFETSTYEAPRGAVEIYDPEAREVNEQSRDAFLATKPYEEKIFDHILSTFERAGDSGLTAYACAVLMNALHQSVSTACAKLFKLGELKRTAYVRRNDSGRDGRVLALPGTEFKPREGDKHSPEKVKPRVPKEVAAAIAMKAIVKELKEKNLVTDLRLLREELLQIVAEIPPMKKEGEAHEREQQ